MLIEGLPKKHFDKGHIPGAINLPYDRLEAVAPQLVPAKERKIVAYCANTACANLRLQRAP